MLFIHRVVKQDFQIISKAFKNQFVIPKFGDFCGHISSIYEDCVSIRAGSVASYIPQLASYSPESWGVSIVTVDGQRYNKGDIQRIVFKQSPCFHSSKRVCWTLAVSGILVFHICVNNLIQGHINCKSS